ncbi:MAG TPA: methyltransferase [Steroidobacteraceae bacterium]|nr:methyltransferase [Steroidobacteraceae bacterium]
MSDSAAPAPVLRLTELIEGYWTTQVIRAAAQLRLPDLLGSESLRPVDLAQRALCHAGSLNRLLRALTSIGLCEALKDGRYALTALGALLRSDAAGGKHARALFAGSTLYRAFESLPDMVRTGGRAAVPADFEKSSPEKLAIFQAAMIESSREAVSSAVLVYDFSVFKRVLDVGGGFGGALAGLLQRFGDLTGDVLDLPHARQGAEAFLAGSGLGSRTRFLAGDFFAAVPQGYDCYLMKFILHDWDDAQAAAILGSVRSAAAPGSRLIVLERLVPDPVADLPAHRAVLQADMAMMAWGGQARTEREYRELLRRAGFELGRVVPTASTFTVLEAAPT